jgi:hypothetical protein
MDQNLSTMIQRLKIGVVERCRERVDRAAEARKGRTGLPEQPPPECGIATQLKKARGL